VERPYNKSVYDAASHISSQWTNRETIHLPYDVATRYSQKLEVAAVRDEACGPFAVVEAGSGLGGAGACETTPVADGDWIEVILGKRMVDPAAVGSDSGSDARVGELGT
jgi:hypothetical protein